MPAEFEAVKRDTVTREGLRTIGVVMFRHQGGVEAIKEQLQANGIDWPHCYDAPKIGNPFESV